MSSCVASPCSALAASKGESEPEVCELLLLLVSGSTTAARAALRLGRPDLYIGSAASAACVHNEVQRLETQQPPGQAAKAAAIRQASQVAGWAAQAPK